MSTGSLEDWALHAYVDDEMSSEQRAEIEQLLLAEPELARKVEVGLYALRPFCHDHPVRDGLIIGFGAIETLDIDPALDRVRAILEQIA